FRAAADDFVETDNIARAHPDASVTRGQTNIPFLRRTMNVNRPRICVSIMKLAATQPKDSCHNWIPTWRVDCNDLAGAESIFEDSANRSMVANLLRDLQLAQWSKRAARSVTKAELGCGDRIDGHQVTAIEKS